MITGVGIDITEVERMASRINQEAGFRELVFTKKEIDYCESKTNKFEHYAARFAAKEAFLKAIGTGWKQGTSFNEIEIIHDNEGKPKMNLLGETANTLSSLHISKILISLSHIKSLATAIVIIEKQS